MNHRATFAAIRSRTGMYIHPERYEVVRAFLSGYAYATGALVGFDEWLVLKLGRGTNLVWEALVDDLVPRGDDRARIDKLFELVDEFLGQAGSMLGRRELFGRFAAKQKPRKRR
jgi:hypothetical protein